MSSMDEERAKFEAKYCPPLDPALLYSILSDFDLSKEGDSLSATAVLEQIKESALLEEAADFDPSGTAFRGDGYEEDDRAASRLEGSADSSLETDTTSVSNGLSSLDLSDDSNDGTLTPECGLMDLDATDEETKISLLLEVFHGKVTTYNARYTLRKYNGKWDAAMEELLNEVGLSEFLQGENGSKVSNKSVDAFAEENGFRRGRKGKKKAAKSYDEQRSSSTPSPPTGASSTLENKWNTSGRDVEFLAKRTGLSSAAVQSLYNSLGASLPRTITAILKKRTKQISQEDREDPILVANAFDLQEDFPTIDRDHVFALIHTTHPSTTAAHELAKALTSRPNTPPGGIQIIPQYARPILDEPDDIKQKAQKRAAPVVYYDHGDSDVTERAASIEAARARAYQQAQAAFRKSKSNPLMGGAAAYYSQEGRTLGALSSRAAAGAADRLAASQSSSSEVDLHGIDVMNAVRIAQERVEQWWASLGENRINGRTGAESRQAGYRIVVGLGTHSAGGRSKLGPAVSKMLRDQGWRIEPNGAVIVVKGPVKR